MSSDPQAPRFVPPSRRRDKPILSCTLCRRRKLKCDRQHPCKTCVDRGLSLSCAYVRNVPTPKEPKIPNSVHDRINQLEKLVTDLMSSKNVTEASPAGSYASQHQDDSHYEIPGTPDRVKFNGETTSYTNSDHWTSILDGISELREHLDHIPTSTDAREGGLEEFPGPELLFGRQRFATKEDILAALPPRREADQLIETFFATMEMHTTFMHRPTFLKQYAKFWLNPFETPTMWIGLLYNAFALGARFQATIEKHLSSTPSSGPGYAQSLYEARMNFYREKAVQCMILANYTKCPPSTMEAFLLYCATEYTRSADAQFSSYVIVGMVVRLAFRMGLHRDPARFPNISPFEGEMRRRKWLIIVSFDLITSSHLGLPRMIQPSMFDTQEPRNLTDDDIYEDMPGPLPPSRPETDPTQLLYFIIVCKIRRVQAQIVDLIETTQQPPYKSIIDLDATLRLIFDKFPKNVEDYSPGTVNISGKTSITRQFYLNLAYLKAQVMLHRPYIKVGRADQHYEYSRRICLNAAMELLTLQSTLDNEIQPRDRFSQPTLRISAINGMMSSIVAQDFLLATSVLILDLDEDLISPLPVSGTRMTGIHNLDSAPPSRQEIVASLRSAYHVWSKASKNSQEARKVAAAVKLVLSKVNENEEHAPSPSHSASDAMAEHDACQTSHFGGNDYTDENQGSAIFPMAGPNCGHAVPFEQMPMDLDSLNIPFEWDGMMANLQLPPCGMLHTPFE